MVFFLSCNEMTRSLSLACYFNPKAALLFRFTLNFAYKSRLENLVRLTVILQKQ